MNSINLVVLTLVFAAVFLGALGVFLATGSSQVKARMGQAEIPDGAGLRGTLGDAPRSPWSISLARITTPFSNLSLPPGGWEDSPLRIRFMHAGYRSPVAPTAFFTLKSALTFILPGLLLAVVYAHVLEVHGTPLLALVLLFALVGYAAPNVLLSYRIARRQREIFETFPDALDLITICVEAGLGLDAALARVGKQIGMESSLLAEELHLVGLELRAGSSRDRALRNLALRTGVDEVDALVAMLVQADRFGTSVADSLRVHAESLRVKRQQRAEEVAAKVPTKLLFPLIFCVFPSMMLVLLGPAFIAISRTLLPTLGGN